MYVCVNQIVLLTLGAQEGYGTCLVSVCLSVSALASTSFLCPVQVRYVQLTFRLFLIVDFEKGSVQKLWREKANMEMSIYSS